ncbi:ras-related and estrogen-regulated growth inhibitor-like protein [Ischnura elegans]|uniref:ras-related and estrogen-regulated growth inhibitor-like protein n=1 Tax=Ischnura elegans TaxID=197161 RepID=UPI001ED89629|nr:ras-related and estrogen-regulated growth inhibitor-like protein [Ischnura elegans]
MSSNAIRAIRRKKSTLSEVRVAVLGGPSVGKSALTVRFLTKRYIGEYDHQSENRYKHEGLVDGEPVLFEILDTCPKPADGDSAEFSAASWADGVLLAYSITDRSSFDHARKTRQKVYEKCLALSEPRPLPPIILVGNKSDMIHLRQVSTEEGEILAKDWDCWFREVAAAEQVTQVAEAFHEVVREVWTARRQQQRHGRSGNLLAAAAAATASASSPALNTSISSSCLLASPSFPPSGALPGQGRAPSPVCPPPSTSSLLGRVLGARAYARGKSDSALPKD